MNPSKVKIYLGPPGTGKTNRLISIVSDLVKKGTRPDKIGFISFTKKAADEGRQRAASELNLSPEDLTHFRTLHSMSFRHLGLRREQVFGWTHLKELGSILGMEFKGKNEMDEDNVYGMNTADRMLFLDGLAKNKMVSIKTIWEQAFEDSIDWFELERFSRALTSFKQGAHVLDFNDMLEKFCSSNIKNIPQLDALIVDESQDLSPMQWKAVELLAENATEVHIAGDDCQGIYRWSGADIEHFIDLKGEQIQLDQSYRIPLSVHKLADSISDRIVKKRSRNWKPRSEPGAINWFNTYEEVDLSKDKWLLLARNGYLLNELEDFCFSQGFSFHSVGRDPLKSPALKAISVWENLRRGNSDSTERILQVLKFIPPHLVSQTLLKKLKADDNGAQYHLLDLMGLGLRTSEIWHQALTRISTRERDYFIAARKRNEPLLKEPRIKISTIHASKGGEADHVLLLSDMSQRCFQNMENNFDDELRVWYVAVTRCKQTLNLIMPKTNLNFEF